MSWVSRALFVIVAVLVGTLFVAVAYFWESADSWGREGRWAAGFGLIYSLALAGGFLVQIAFAVLLRWIAHAGGLRRPIHWVVLGGMLGVAVPWSLARLGYLIEGSYFSAGMQGVKRALMFPLTGAMMYTVQPVSVLAAVGGATGAVLWLVAVTLDKWTVRRGLGVRGAR
jgi:hypothetical protein